MPNPPYPDHRLGYYGESLETVPDQVKQPDWPPTQCYQLGRPWEANEVTGERYQSQCKHRRACVYHAHREAQQLALVMDQARPTHILTITFLPSNWPKIHDVMGSLLLRIRYRWENLPWAYAVEQEPEQQPHAHILVRAPVDLDRETLCTIQRKMVPRHHTGDLHVASFRADSRPSSYLLKTFDPTCYTNSIEAIQKINCHLDLNGRRMVHASANFHLAEDGEVTKRRHALAEVHDRLRRTT